ncbi:MAG: hypothetical protein PHS79_01930 [Patescibacteria group bacterium]|nr:hypothetical protein [Patescibacteria group bacterium]
MFISVIPSIKMPIGHDFFDYKLDEGTAHVGDLILVPFRNKLIPALVAKISPRSQFADKAITLTNPRKILKLPEALADYCIACGRETFVSPATMLNAWLRNVPKRLADNADVHIIARQTRRPSNAKTREDRYLVNRYSPPDGIIGAAQDEQANGRVLILTPWQSRVAYLQNKLGCQGFDAQTADGKAWKIWTSFLNNPHSILVTTRLGAWLAACVDVVIIDEPENDDYKQDELTPRYDARRLVELAQTYNPSLRTINIGTTPSLSSLRRRGFIPSSVFLANAGIQYDKSEHIDSTGSPGLRRTAPEDDKKTKTDIDAHLQTETLSPGSRSSIETLTAQTFNALSKAADDKRPVRILHAVVGTRGRVRCADCGWSMNCPACGYGMSNLSDRALCRRCNHKEPLPQTCPTCGGADLAKSIIGAELLQKQLERQFSSSNIKVLDLNAWQSQSITPKSLIIVTNLNFIGGYTEDIRRKERLVISFRRLASQASLSQSDLLVQGPEGLVNECRTWLSDEGLQRTWENELKDRQAFDYPPTRILAKLIVSLDLDKTDPVTVDLQQNLVIQGWEIKGPYKVENRPNSRQQRVIYHLLPPPDMTRVQSVEVLTPFSRLGILDLDPIAFFS